MKARKRRTHKNTATVEDAILMLNTGVLDTQMLDLMEKYPNFTICKVGETVFVDSFPEKVLRGSGKTLRAAVLNAMSNLEKSQQ